MRKKRILVCQFHQESNTFNPITVPIEQGNEIEGSAFYDKYTGYRSSVCGMTDAIEQAGGEVVPTISLRPAGSGGRLEDQMLERMKARMEHYIRTAREFDAVCAELHGATCTVSCDDACGELLEFLRRLVDNRPIVACCDLHANITDRMLRCADIICGYQTYPHLDQYETGNRAGKLCMRLLTGEKLYMAAVHVPLMTPPAGYSTMHEPFKSVIDSGKRMVQTGELEDFSVFNVQPWLDIPEIASTAIAIGVQPHTAKEKAQILAQNLFDVRERCWPDLLSVDEIIDRAQTNTSGKPVVVADSADSANGGAVGDSPAIAMRLLERGSKLRSAIFIKDPASVKQAFDLGVGAKGRFSIGAGFTPNIPGPMVAEGYVCSLHDGWFVAEGASRGKQICIGQTAVIRFGTLDVLVCEKPAATGDPQIFRHFGIEPTLYDLVVVKANTSFRAYYSTFAHEICYADTPGAGASNLKQFQWHNLPRNFYPFDLPEDYQIGEAIVR